ncbi:TPA: shufflon system plasmid conjugative transfer pilus tip adhesin PilV, partial [Salmonella enterica subsp. enterica serovar Muenchen]
GIFLKRNCQGFTLVELILTLAVIAAISFISFQSMNRDFEEKQAASAGEQIRNVGTGVNNYIVNHYDVLSKLENSTGTTQDMGPRTCTTTTSTCEITTQTLVNEGMLPPVFNGKNVYGSGYKIIISRKGSAPYWNISALVSTDTPLSRSGSIRYDLLGKAMQTAGIDSGMTRTASNKVDGYKGSWSATQTEFSNINKQGLLAYIAGYGSNSYSAFLRRDGTLPMTGDLNMGTKNIYGAANITATGKGTFGGEVDAGSWIHARNGYGDLISIGGDAAANDYEIRMDADKPLSIHMKSNRNDITALNVTGGVAVAGILNTTGNITAGGEIVAHNGYGDSIFIGGDKYSGGIGPDYEIRMGANKPLTIHSPTSNRGIDTILDIDGNTRIQTNLNVLQHITASGNIESSGNIKGGTLESSGRTTVGEFIQLNGTVSEGNVCSTNGLIGRVNDGTPVYCINGYWTNIASSKTQNGGMLLPGGMKIMWGTLSGNLTDYGSLDGLSYFESKFNWYTPTFSVNGKTYRFSNIFSVQFTPADVGGAAMERMWGTLNGSGFSYAFSSAIKTTMTGTYLAIGY